MGLDQLAFVEDLHRDSGGADIDAAADQLPGHRVEGAADLDVDVRADRCLRPSGQHERLGRQRKQSHGLHRLEHRQRLRAAQRAALPLTCDVRGPEQGLGLHVLQRGECPPTPERVTDIGHGPLDPGLVLRLRSAGRVHQRAVVTGEFGIGLVDLRVIEVRLVHPGLEVVRHKPARDAAEEAEGFRVRERPGVLVHVHHRADEHMPRGGQHHHERPDPVPFPGSWVDPLPQEPVVDLSLRARLDVLPQHRDLGPGRLFGQVLVHPAAERRQRRRQLALVPQPLMDRRDRRGLQQALHVLAVRLDLSPPHLVQLPAGQLWEPALEQLGPVRLAHGRPARSDRRG